MQRLAVLCLASIIWLLAANSLLAQSVYMWTDSKGEMHITNDPPPAGAKGVEAMDSTPPPPPEPSSDEISPPSEGTDANGGETEPEVGGENPASATESEAPARRREIERELTSLAKQREEAYAKYRKARNIDYSRALTRNLEEKVNNIDARIMSLQEELRRLD